MGECNTCDGKLESIYESLDGALSCQDLEELNAHLSECQHCAKEYDLECVIRSVIKRSCSEVAPTDLKSKIMARIDSLRETEHPVA